MNNNNIDALILAGGKGTRLQTVVNDRPKVMADINGFPFLNILIDKLIKNGFKKIILSIGYMADYIENYYQKNDFLPYLKFVKEKKELGTGGAIRKAGRYINSNQILVMNGDSYCGLDLNNMVEAHQKNEKALVTVALVESKDRQDAGNVSINDKNYLITDFKEKEDGDKYKYISAGVYVIDKKVLEFIPEDLEFSLEHSLLPRLTSKNLYGFMSKEELIDIGTLDRYKKALEFFKKL